MPTDQQFGPTPFPDVNATLQDLLRHVRTILGDHFIGMYLDGSLALGDFSPERSDIDYVVASDADFSDESREALRIMHARFNDCGSPWATEVEAFYVQRDALRCYNPARTHHLRIERGANEVLRSDQLDRSWVIHLHVLRERSLIVAGPAPRTLIDPVDPDDLRLAMAEIMESWWGPMRTDTRPLLRHHIGYQAYAVLTMCRVLYTLDSGAVASKPAAALWVQQTLGGHWSGIVDRALAWRKSGTCSPPDGDVGATVDLNQYTLERCREWALHSGDRDPSS